jgi:aspartate/methionine/tyrosine aminotransferase
MYLTHALFMTCSPRTPQKGLTPRFLLLTNPNNPLGIVYSPDTIRRLVEWGRCRDMHVIVDEVYALSTHPPYQRAFQSVVKVLNNRLGHDVHLLYALSKDFGSSGLRVGMLYTQNDDLLDALPSVNIYTCVPGPIQYLVAELLTDDRFVESFLETSRNRLQYSYQICAQKLDEMVIPYVPAMAGVFVYVDFSSLIPSRRKTEASRREWETEFGRLVFRYARLVMTPGSVQHDPYPGMFRICYGWVSVDVLQIAMERLSRLVAKVRRLDWDDLNERTLAGVLDVGIY